MKFNDSNQRGAKHATAKRYEDGRDEFTDMNNHGKSTTIRSPLFDVLKRDEFAPKTYTTPSLYSQFVPVTPLVRPQVAQAAWARPSTGRSHFSIEEARRKQRRIFEADLNTALPSSRDPLKGLGLGAARRPQHNHSRRSCRQCFRSGFDCAIQLQKGKGTAARRALQDFVAAGGISASSGVEDFFEGSLYAGQIANSRPASRSAGLNFVDKLSEVAFGESALSRPVTRDAVQTMLDLRSQGILNPQSGKTVNEFMTELQLLQDQQLNTPHPFTENKGASGRSYTCASSVSSAETMHDQHVDADNLLRDGGEGIQTHMRPFGDASRFSQHDEDMESTSQQDDCLSFLADRWTWKQKHLQLGICALWIFVMHCLDSGYDESKDAIAASLKPDLLLLRFGRLAFLAGQGGGLLGGATLSPYGRYCLQPITVVLALALSLIAGFMHQFYPLLALRGALGFLAGVFELSVCGMVLDLSAKRRERLFMIAILATSILAGQSAGPWIAKLVLAIATWRWLYWMTTVAAAMHLIASGAFVQETEPISIFRGLIKRLRTQHHDVWTPEAEPIPGVIKLIKIYSLQTLHLLFQHVLVVLCALFSLVLTASITAVTSTIPSQLMVRYGLSEWQTTLLISACILLGFCTCLTCIILVAVRSDQDVNERRMRFLLMDEKGIIDPVRPSLDVETLLRNGLCGLIAAGVSSFTLAFTSALTHWIFPALSLVALTSGTTISLISMIQYVSEAYYPSARTCLADLDLLPDHHERPRSLSSSYAGRAQVSHREVSDLDNTLMSGADLNGKRWNPSWALSALAIIMCAAFSGAGLMTLLAPLAVQYLGFPVFAAILSSVELSVGGICMLTLLCLGKRLRHKAFVLIAQMEQKNGRRTAKHRLRSSTAVFAPTSIEALGSPPHINHSDGSNMHAVSRPTYCRFDLSDWLRSILAQSVKQPEKGIAALKRRFVALFSPKSDLSKTCKKPMAIHQLQISQPFNFEHLATGTSMRSPATLQNPVSPNLTPRPLLAGDRSPRRTMALEEQVPKYDLKDAAHWTHSRPTLRRIGRKELERAMSLHVTADLSSKQHDTSSKVLLPPPPTATAVQEESGTIITQPPLSAVGKSSRQIVYRRQNTPPTDIVYQRPQPIAVPIRTAAANVRHSSSTPASMPVASTSRRTLTPRKEGMGKAATASQTQVQRRQRQAAHGGAQIANAV